MGRRSLAAFWLLLFLASQAATQARPLLASAAQECRCDERLCRCTHEHKKPAVPSCHFPDGTTLPSFKSCNTDEQQAVAARVYLLPQRLPLTQPVPGATLRPASVVRVPLFCPEVSPPPPRTPLT